MSSDPEVKETMTASALPTRSRRIREPIGALAALAVLVIAVAAAIGARSAPAQLGIGESVASASSNFLAQIASGLPFGYAFAAGMVAAVNPCGFALLPGYLGLYLGTEHSAEQLPRRLLRAAGIALVVSASFVVLFGAAGVVVAATSSGIALYFPWIGLAVGVALVAAGASALVGADLHLNLGDRLGDRAGDTARRGGVVGYAAYGVAYAAASLGCTLPIFLSVIAAGMTAGGPARALFQFVLYGLGMGLVLSALTLVAAVVGHGAIRGLRRVGAFLQPLGAVVLLLAGGYVVYYWLTIGGILFGIG